SSEVHMNEERFWSMIEDAWKNSEGADKARGKLVKGKLDDDDVETLIEQSVDEMVPALQAALEALKQKDLLELDRILEGMLHEIDREDVLEHTDGGDDGFLYCRGFIVAAGKDYYDAVNKKPSLAVMDAECEDLCYLPVRVYQEKFGDMPDSGISR